VTSAARPRRPLAGRALFNGLVAVGLPFAGCAAMDDPQGQGVRQLKQRPTAGDGTVFEGYRDAAALSLESEAGFARVWYTETLPHRPDPTDVAPADGIPDMVQLVADTADAVALELQAGGWRLPVPDTSIAGQADDGGSPAFDIYLVDFQRADGLFFVEGCLNTIPAQCTGYIAIKNDFRSSGYSSVAEGVNVLVSHEYFHAVQAAYTDQLPIWFSEGTATWHEEYFEPSQDDFERLASIWFEQGDRSINGTPNGPSDLSAYSTAIFFHYLQVTTGSSDPIRESLELMADTDAAAEQALLQTIGGIDEFAALQAGFAAWNLCTGDRTIEGFGYEAAHRVEEIDLVALDGSIDTNWDTEVRAWAQASAELDRSTRDLRLEVRTLDGWPDPPSLVVVDPSEGGAWSVIAPGESAVFLASDSPLLLAFINPDPDARTAGRLAIRSTDATSPVVPDPDPSEGSDCAPGGECGADGSAQDGGDPTGTDDGGCTASEAGARPAVQWLGWISLMVLLPRRRALV